MSADQEFLPGPRWGTGLSSLGPEPESGSTEQPPSLWVSGHGTGVQDGLSGVWAGPAWPSSERASPQWGLSSWPVEGAQGSLRSAGRARVFRAGPPHPRCGEGARQSQSLLPAPLDSLPLLPGAAPPTTSALAPGPPIALSAPNKTFGAGGPPATEAGGQLRPGEAWLE